MKKMRSAILGGLMMASLGIVGGTLWLRRSTEGKPDDYTEERAPTKGIPASMDTEKDGAQSSVVVESGSIVPAKETTQEASKDIRDPKRDSQATDVVAPRSAFARELPWSRPGQCMDQAASEERAIYLATFETRNIEGVRVHVAPTVPVSDADDLAALLSLTHERAANLLDVQVPVAEVFLHASAAELREHACVASVAVAYYDGAIHIAPLGSRRELERSLRHEYAHHVLISMGVGKPIWLQEGFAMSFAGDEPHDYWATWRKTNIDLDAMVEPSGRASSDDDVRVFYSHAAVMYEFLKRLCLGREACGPGSLVRALIAENTLPAELFLWATERRTEGLTDTEPLRFWQEYEHEGNFTPETLTMLLARARNNR